MDKLLEENERIKRLHRSLPKGNNYMTQGGGAKTKMMDDLNDDILMQDSEYDIT